jgi:hypothetical protein
MRDYRSARVERTKVSAIEYISADGRYLDPMVIWAACTHRSSWTTFPSLEWHYACTLVTPVTVEGLMPSRDSIVRENTQASDQKDKPRLKRRLQKLTKAAQRPLRGALCSKNVLDSCVRPIMKPKYASRRGRMC